MGFILVVVTFVTRVLAKQNTEIFNFDDIHVPIVFRHEGLHCRLWDDRSSEPVRNLPEPVTHSMAWLVPSFGLDSDIALQHQCRQKKREITST